MAHLTLEELREDDALLQKPLAPRALRRAVRPLLDSDPLPDPTT
jgi:hypothetical protein